jgi:hypothetical protein
MLEAYVAVELAGGAERRGAKTYSLRAGIGECTSTQANSNLSRSSNVRRGNNDSDQRNCNRRGATRSTMTREWEERFAIWAQPPSETARLKAGRAETAVRSAVSNSSELQRHDVWVFAQGSYRNRTNVRHDSDVDICVCTAEAFFFELPYGKNPSDYNIITPGPYAYSAFKNDVWAALGQYFGLDSVSRGDKAFDVHENTYRIDADVIPCFEYRYYPEGGGCAYGTAFIADSGTTVTHNFPQQNYDNGVEKNNRTSRRFKAIVRVLKTLCYQMQAEGIGDVRNIPSYLIECLCWNVPDHLFMLDSLADSVGAVVADIWNRTGNDFVYRDWFEVNGIKFLFHGSQPWTQAQANAFALAAWNYVGFE